MKTETIEERVVEAYGIDVKHCATSMDAAMLLVEKVEKKFISTEKSKAFGNLFVLRRFVACTTSHNPFKEEIVENWQARFFGMRFQTAPTPQLAICKAALKLHKDNHAPPTEREISIGETVERILEPVFRENEGGE